MSGEPSVVGLGEIPLFEIKARYFFIRGIDNAALAQEVLASDTDRSRRASNDKKMFSPQYEDVLFEPGTEANKLTACIEAIGASINCQLLSGVWAQVHHQYESCNLHDHAGEGLDYGFVYYVTVPKGAGSLYFEVGGVGRSVVQPIEGMCVVFPASLKHGVSKNMAKELRISIAGNFTLKS
jgi:hypothetical protein